MRGIDRIRVVFALVFVLGAFVWEGLGETLLLDGVGEALAAAAFGEFGLSATLDGEARWSGTIALDTGDVSVVASGSLHGVGVYSLVDLILEAWLGYSASGAATDGRVAEIRGLLYLKRETRGILRSGESVSGTHYTVVDVDGRVTLFHGSFIGSATGAVVPSDAPLTIQAEGYGSVRLSGSAIDPSGELLAGVPLDHGALSSEFVETVRSLFIPEAP